MKRSLAREKRVHALPACARSRLAFGLIHAFIAVAVTLTSTVAAAADAVTVANAWMRPAGANDPIAPVYLDIVSAEWARVVELQSPVAASVAIVDPGATDDRNTRTTVVLKPRTTVRFAPRGRYIELRALRRELRNGDKVPLALTLLGADEKRTTTTTQIEVRGLSLQPALVPRPNDAKGMKDTKDTKDSTSSPDEAAKGDPARR
ncbi:MAG: copper chaperone PCu(A)C [Pseudomonadota bacterium]|nr:copper chaperone PCu(A)C [Pseudomonadota bacterium]